MASENCSYVGQHSLTTRHVLRNHVDKSSVPHRCNLCGYKCASLGMLKGHRSWYKAHINAMERAAASGKKINEDKEENHSNNPVNLEELMEKVTGE